MTARRPGAPIEKEAPVSSIGWFELLIIIGVVGVVLAAIVAFGMRRR